MEFRTSRQIAGVMKPLESACQLQARSATAFDNVGLPKLEQSFQDLPGPVDHVKKR